MWLFVCIPPELGNFQLSGQFAGGAHSGHEHFAPDRVAGGRGHRASHVAAAAAATVRGDAGGVVRPLRGQAVAGGRAAHLHRRTVRPPNAGAATVRRCAAATTTVRGGADDAIARRTAAQVRPTHRRRKLAAAAVVVWLLVLVVVLRLVMLLR